MTIYYNKNTRRYTYIGSEEGGKLLQEAFDSFIKNSNIKIKSPEVKLETFSKNNIANNLRIKYYGI